MTLSKQGLDISECKACFGIGHGLKEWCWDNSTNQGYALDLYVLVGGVVLNFLLPLEFPNFGGCSLRVCRNGKGSRVDGDHERWRVAGEGLILSWSIHQGKMSKLSSSELQWDRSKVCC